MDPEIAVIVRRLGLADDAGAALAALIDKFQGSRATVQKGVAIRVRRRTLGAGVSWFPSVKDEFRKLSDRHELDAGFEAAAVRELQRFIREAKVLGKSDQQVTKAPEAIDSEPSAVDVIAGEADLPAAGRAALARLIERWCKPATRPTHDPAQQDRPRVGQDPIDRQLLLLSTEHDIPWAPFKESVDDLLDSWCADDDSDEVDDEETLLEIHQPPDVGAPSDAPAGPELAEFPADPDETHPDPIEIPSPVAASKRSAALPSEFAQEEDVDDPLTSSRLPSRYADTGMLGVGGMGEVRRLQDAELRRSVAMKALREDLEGNDDVLARFVAEAQVTGQLQHPGIVPVYDIGRLPDGRVFYTMQEIRGIEFTDVIDELHEAREAAGNKWVPTESGWTLRRAVDVLHRVCEAIAFAHNQGVVHRDLKPDNIMVGEFGEVLVVDWGIAKVEGATEATAKGAVRTVRSEAGKTLDGLVAGTPGYMPPEQVLGRSDLQGPHTDVYALGAILYEVLSGLPPCDDGAGDDIDVIMSRTLQGEIDPLPEDSDLPESLVQIATKALCLEPEERYATGRELALELGAYLEGAKRKERALELLAQATEKSQNGLRLRNRAGAIRQAGHVDAGDDDDHAEPMGVVWKREEQAQRLDHGADVIDVVVTQLASAALAQYQELPEAHELLADHYRHGHAFAESRGDRATAERLRILLNAHDRGRYARYLKGDGAFSLVTDPPGASVEIFKYVEKERRFEAEPYGDRLTTPIMEHPIPMGSYQLIIRAEGHRTVRYPIHIKREEHWDGIPPGESEAQPIRLPTTDQIADDEVYIPAGWATFGTHDFGGSLPFSRCWIDDFVMRRHPVTNREFLRFIVSLVQNDRLEDVSRHAPQGQGFLDEPGPIAFVADKHGNFTLPQDWGPGGPVSFVDWHSVKAYALWKTIQDGVRWTLPHELQWEKAARGTDGRPFPWGTDLAPEWCAMRASVAEPQDIEAFRADVSPYGVRGLGGNIRDWCLNIAVGKAPVADGSRLIIGNDNPVRPTDYIAVRGGSWVRTRDECRPALRQAHRSGSRFEDLGFRLVRQL